MGIRAEIRIIALIFILGIIFWSLPPLIFDGNDNYLDEVISLIVVQFFLMLMAMKLSTPLSMNNIPCTSYAKVYTKDAIILSVEFVKSHSMDFGNSTSDDGQSNGGDERDNLFSPRTSLSMLNKFNALLQDKDGFEYFANALVQEFAIEVKMQFFVLCLCLLHVANFRIHDVYLIFDDKYFVLDS